MGGLAVARLDAARSLKVGQAASHLLWRRTRMPLFSCTLALWGHTCSAPASALPATGCDHGAEVSANSVPQGS